MLEYTTYTSTLRIFELVIEYIVKCSLGEVSVKMIYMIYSRNPIETLARYYKYETEVARNTLYHQTAVLNK